MKNYRRLYAIADYITCITRGIHMVDFADAFFSAGGQVIQLRDKSERPAGEKRNDFREISQMAADKSFVIINDDADLAAELNCGLHLGQTDSAGVYQKQNLTWGRSTHDINEVSAALSEKPQPDYIGFGTMFKGGTKNHLNVARYLLTDIMSLWQGPLVLIGGITLENVQQLPKADGIYYAVISDFFRYGSSTDDIKKYTAEFLSLFKDQT